MSNLDEIKKQISEMENTTLLFRYADVTRNVGKLCKLSNEGGEYTREVYASAISLEGKLFDEIITRMGGDDDT